MFFAQLGDVSSMERSPSIVVSYLVCEDMCNQIPSKKWKLYDSSWKFQDAWTTRLNGQNLLLMRRGWCNTLHARFAHLLKGKKNCFWIAYLSMLGVQMVFMLGVDASSHYFNKNSVHGNNECDFFVVKYLSILDQLQIDVLSK